jgi:hypothetical protein
MDSELKYSRLPSQPPSHEEGPDRKKRKQLFVRNEVPPLMIDPSTDPAATPADCAESSASASPPRKSAKAAPRRTLPAPPSTLRPGRRCSEQASASRRLGSSSARLPHRLLSLLLRLRLRPLIVHLRSRPTAIRRHLQQVRAPRTKIRSRSTLAIQLPQRRQAALLARPLRPCCQRP